MPGLTMNSTAFADSVTWKIDEPVIDTTKPEFVENFKGFIGAPGA